MTIWTQNRKQGEYNADGKLDGGLDSSLRVAQDNYIYYNYLSFHLKIEYNHILK